MTAQNFYRWAWALEIIGPATIRVATTDLPEAAAVATLGDFYIQGIKNVDTRLVEGQPNTFFGVRHRSNFTLIVSNANGDMDTTADWRGAPYTLWLYDRELDTKAQDSIGIVLDAQFANGQAVVAFGVDEGLLQNLLPAARIDPKPSSPFERAGSPGAPLPVVFGNDVLLQPPSIHGHGAVDPDEALDGLISAFDYAVGFDDDLIVSAVWSDTDRDRPGQERIGTWTTAPGSPAYLTTEADPLIRATRFAVTGPQIARYEAGMPIRFKTTASGSAYVYSVVKSYDSVLYAGELYGTNPDNNPPIYRVEIRDALIDSGLTGVQLAGDYAIVRDVYTTVTDGILPVPAEGQAFTVLRMYGLEDGAPTVLAGNPTYPSGAGGTSPSTIIADIITNNVWGLSTRVQQLTYQPSFVAAESALSDAGLLGAVQGALAYDGKQVPAEQVLDWLLMICRGGRLGMNQRGTWTLGVDGLVDSVQTFVFGPGEESGVRIKKIISYGRTPMDRAVRNLILHWSPLGRVNSRSTKLQPTAYTRFSTKAVSSIGRDRDIVNPFIRSETVAGIVLQYMAEMLKGADEQLVFVAGPEARSRLSGEVITATSTVDGFSGQWKITEVAKSLADVQLTCIRYRTEAFDAPTGITTSSEPTEITDMRTAPGPGPNLLPNPEPAPPLQLADNLIKFNDLIISPTYSRVTPGIQIPYGWGITKSSSAILAEFSVDHSDAMRSRTVSGHYFRMVWTTVNPFAPATDALHSDGIVSEAFRVRPGHDHLVSFYGDADEGWYVLMHEDNNLIFRTTLLPLVRDDTDTDGNGWTRFYGRWRPQNASARAIMGVCVSKPGTYQGAGLMVEAVEGSARKPSGWRRHTAAPRILTRSEEITLDGSTTYTAALIKAGDYVLGATARATGEIHFGTATHFELGTDNDPDVWARNIRDPFALTTSSNFKSGTVAYFAAEDQDVVLSFLQNVAGTPPTEAAGTATSGKVMIVLEYTRSAPTPGP